MSWAADRIMTSSRRAVTFSRLTGQTMTSTAVTTRIPMAIDARKRVDELQSQIDALWNKLRHSMLQAGRASAARETERRASRSFWRALPCLVIRLSDRRFA